MIEQGLFQKHFVGRDGFQWWIGQVPSSEVWKENKPGKNVNSTSDSDYRGYGERYKVRIMGYHTASKEEMPDEDLPWASVMYPVTAGSGGGHSSQTSNITQGTFVYGFFLDGEQGQQPVIMGCIGYNDYQTVMRNVPNTGFVPFRGLPSPERIPPTARPVSSGGQTLRQEESSGSVVNGRETTGVESSTNIKDQNTKDAADEDTAVAAEPTTCEPIPVSKMQQQIRNLIRDVERAKKSLYDFEQGAMDDIANKEQWINQKIEEKAEAIAAGLKSIYEQIEKFVNDKTNEALKFAYDIAFPNERNRVKQTSQTILDTIACFFRKLFGQLLQLVIKFLKDAVDRVINVSKCFVENFVGTILGALSGIVEGLFSGITNLISGAVDVGEGALDLGTEVLGLIDNIISFLSCDAPPQCAEVNEWNIVTGGNKVTRGDIDSIVSRAKDLSQQTVNVGLDALDNFESLVDIDFKNFFDLDACNIREVLCGAPILEFFGSDGVGAAGNLIIGAAGDVIGVDMISFGVGYTENTQAKVIDICGKGSGAVLRPIFGRIPTDGTSGAGVGGGTPATSPPNIGFGPFQPQNYPFPGGPGPSLSPVPLGNPGGVTPYYGSGPTNFGNQLPPECIDVEFTVTRSADLSNIITFRLVDAEPGFINGWDYTGDDVSDGQQIGGSKYVECVVPGVDYIVKAFLPDGAPTPNPLRIDAGGSTVRMDDAWDGGVETITEEIIITAPTEASVTFNVTFEASDEKIFTIDGLGINFYKGESVGDVPIEGGQDYNVVVETGRSYDVTLTSPRSPGVKLRTPSPNTILTEDSVDNDFDDLVIIASSGRFYDVRPTGNPAVSTAKFIVDREEDKVQIVETTRKIGYVSDGDYLDLVVTAGAGKFRNVKGHTCLYRLEAPAESDGPGFAQVPQDVGTPVLPPILIPAPAPDGDIGIVDVLVLQSGGGYLPGPDGSKGGDGRTWADPDDTIVVREDGRIETPIPPDNYFCVNAGDTVELPPGTSVVTEPNGGQGGGELIVGGAPYVMKKPGCFTTPPADYEQDVDGYPVILYLCDIIIDNPGFGYEPNDRVVIEPDRGAEAEIRVDKFGRITDVKVTKPGEGFKELPTIYIDSDNGYNAVLVPKLCIDKDVELDDPEKIVQVVDCVGKF